MSFKFLTIFAVVLFYTNNADKFCYTEVLKGMQPKCTNIACESSFNSAAEKCHLDENCFGFATTADKSNHICSCLKKEVDCYAPDWMDGSTKAERAEKLQKGDYNFLMPLPNCDDSEPCFIQIFDVNSKIYCSTIASPIMSDDPVSGKTVLDLAKETCWNNPDCSSFSIGVGSVVGTGNDGATEKVYFRSYNCGAIIENQVKKYIQYLRCHTKYEFDTESESFADLDDDYQFVVDAAPFDVAESQCQSTFGTNLASVHDKQDWNAAKCLCHVSGENECWLGGKSCLDWTDGTGFDYNPDPLSISTGERTCIENQAFNPFCSESNVFNPICNNADPNVAACTGPASFTSIPLGDEFTAPMPTTVTFKDEGEITINANPIFKTTIADKISVYKFAPDPDKRDVNLFVCSIADKIPGSYAGFCIFLFDKCGKEHRWEPQDLTNEDEISANQWCDGWATASNLASNSNARKYHLYLSLNPHLNTFDGGEVYIGIYSDIVKDYGFVVYPRQGTMPAPPLISEPPKAKTNKLDFLPYNYQYDHDQDQPNTYTYPLLQLISTRTVIAILILTTLITICFCFGVYYFFKRKRAKLYSFQKVDTVGDEEEERLAGY